MIEKIYHLADIHIRNLQRHKEYRLVFEKFLNQVRKDNYKNAVIYLAGDIAHAKTEMSPELVQEISWLFTECAKLHDTFIITGTSTNWSLLNNSQVYFKQTITNQTEDYQASLNVNYSTFILDDFLKKEDYKLNFYLPQNEQRNKFNYSKIIY